MVICIFTSAISIRFSAFQEIQAQNFLFIGLGSSWNKNKAVMPVGFHLKKPRRYLEKQLAKQIE